MEYHHGVQISGAHKSPLFIPNSILVSVTYIQTTDRCNHLWPLTEEEGQGFHVYCGFYRGPGTMKHFPCKICVMEGGGWGNQVMDIKEGMGCNEHWVLHTTEESPTSTSETDSTLYVN